MLMLNTLGTLLAILGLAYYPVIGYIYGAKYSYKGVKTPKPILIGLRLTLLSVGLLAVAVGAMLKNPGSNFAKFIVALVLASFIYSGIIGFFTGAYYAAKYTARVIIAGLVKSKFTDSETIVPSVHEFEFLEQSGQKDGVW
jgi:hypothetical protein